MLENFYKNLLFGNRFSYVIEDDNEIFGAVMIGEKFKRGKKYFYKIKLSFTFSCCFKESSIHFTKIF